MKAIVFEQYGSPDVLQLIDSEKPTPKENEVLIEVHAASANPLDWHRMRAEPFLARLDGGLFKPKDPKLGADVAGVVAEVGSDVTQFKVGDRVFGEIWTGSFAEYAIAPEHILAKIPENISFKEAAAIPVVGFTALQGLVDTGNIQAGETVLVNGASGGVGSTAVQIAKAMGATVTGVCSTRNLELVQSIGADHVIDYTREDFTNNGKQYDLIYDAVGNRSSGELKRALKPKGRAVIAGFTTMGMLFNHMLISRFVSESDGRKIGMMGTAQAKQDDLQTLAEMMAVGKLKALIDKCYPLEETADAIRYLETMRARGKVIITVKE